MDCLTNVIGISENDCPCIDLSGKEAVSNPNFQLDLSGWDNDSGWVWNNSGTPVALLQGVPGNQTLCQTISLVVGATYVVRVESTYAAGAGSPILIIDGTDHHELTTDVVTFEYVATSSQAEICINGDAQGEGQVAISSVSFQFQDNSESGLYIDNSESQGIKLKGLSDTRNCQEADELWNLLVKIRSESIDEFLTMFDVTLNQDKLKKHANQSFQIGDYKKGTGALVVSQYPFACITPKRPYKGQIFKISCIRLRFNGSYSGPIPWWVYANDEVVYSGTANMTNGSVEITTKMRLPTMDKYGNCIDYKIVYNRGTGFPIDYKWNCGCGSGVRSWQGEFNVHGGSVSDLNDLEDAQCNLPQSVGMQIAANYECDALGFLCSFDYSENYGYQAVIAKTILLIAQARMARYLLKSDKVNIWTLCKREELTNNLADFNKEIEWRLRYLAQEYSYSFSDCFICSDASGIHLIDIGT